MRAPGIHLKCRPDALIRRVPNNNALVRYNPEHPVNPVKKRLYVDLCGNECMEHGVRLARSDGSEAATNEYSGHFCRNGS